MQSILIAVKVVAPLFVLMTAGYILRTLKAVPASAFSYMNDLCFKFFLPVLLFKNIVSAPSAAFDPRVMCYVAAVQIVTMFVSIVFVPPLIKDRPAAASCAQAVFRSNFVAVGLALVVDIVDAGGLALVSFLGASTVLLSNFCSVIILESLRGGKVSFSHFLKNIVTNPLIIASVAGVVCWLAGIKFAGVPQKVLDDIGGAATPLALICLGGLFDFSSVRRSLKPVVIGTAGRLLVIPAIALAGAVLMGFRDSRFVAVAAVFMPPTAVASFSMAKQMGADADIAALLVVTTSIFSLFSMAFWLALTNYLSLW